MASTARINKVAICGLGLIGGSIALDLQVGRKKLDLTAYDRPKVLELLAKDRRFKIRCEKNLATAVADADLIILAATHVGIRQMLTKLAGLRNMSDALIIDTSAVKRGVMAAADKLRFDKSVQFVSTHPMSGREKAGFANAAAGLFRDHAWYIDDDVKLTTAHKLRLQWLMKKTGGEPVFISNKLHDELVSEISHLPQLLSTLLAAQVNPELIPLAGPGLRSMLRLAGSPHKVWAEIIEENRSEIVKALQTYEQNIKALKAMIRRNQSLADLFSEAGRSYKCLS